MKPKYPLLLVALFLLCALIFGLTFRSNSDSKALVTWSERNLSWDDFEEVDSMEEDYAAMIFSDIVCPDLITDANSKVYAFMNPNLSQRLGDQSDSYNLLAHEQYHFHLTEYCARLLRKDMVERGLGGLSFHTIKSLKTKYAKKLDSLQNVYDSITDHNLNTRQQRYWELQIDDWLRQTAYYKNEDIYSYYDFTKNRTRFYRYIYFTSTYKLLTSYPVGEKDVQAGETYEIDYSNHREKTVKFYKDGRLTNGGYFDAAIVKIHTSKDGAYELHYHNPDGTYNTKIPGYRRKSTVDDDRNRIDRYYNTDGERTGREAIFETRWKYDADEDTYYTSYFDKEGKPTANEDGIFHEKRKLDDNDRTVYIENFDRHHKPKNDDDAIARYEMELNDANRRSAVRFYDETGEFAYHLNDYHLAYEYDARGNTTKIISLNENGERTYDKNGASIYEYTYDLYDRETSVKRYNTDHSPVIANDDYSYRVKDYDSLGRVAFEAYYYPGYVLKFSDSKIGALRYTYINDSILKEQNVDAYGNIFENNNGIAITKKVLNAKKQVLKETYLDAAENFAKTEDETVAFHYDYDKDGNKMAMTAYDSIGNPIAFEADAATARWKYDERGNKLETIYYGTTDKLAYATDSITYTSFVYDKKNRLIEQSNFDITKEPTEINGVFRTRFVVDSEGRDSITFVYNAQNQLKSGVAITKYFYNRHGNRVRTAYYDAKHQRTTGEDGVSALKYTYNKRQSPTGYEYYNTYDRPVNNRNGVAVEESILDELGHTLTYRYFDKNRGPVLGEYGYHKIDYEWDEMGQTTMTTTYGVDNKLIEDEYGTAIYKYKLAPSGLIATVERYNKEGILADNSNAVAITHYEPKLNGLYFLEKEVNAMGRVVRDTIPE